MDPVTHPELDAKLEAMEARTDAKIDGIRNLIDGFFIRAEERDKAAEERFKAMDRRFSHIDDRFTQIDSRFSQIDDRFSQIDDRFTDLSHEMKDMRRSLSGQRYWMVGTGIATLLGVAALNVAGQANIVAAFESGNTIAAAIVRNSEAINQLRDRPTAPAGTLSDPG